MCVGGVPWLINLSFVVSPPRFWSVKRIDPFGSPSVNVSDERLKSRLRAELGRSATTTLLVRSGPHPTERTD